MNLIKKYNSIHKFIIYILIITSIQTILNLFININTTINQTISLIALISFVFIQSFKKGKTTEKQAYKEGIKIGIIYILILYIIGLPLLLYKISIKRIIYYSIIIVISILGTILGINKKTQ